MRAAGACRLAAFVALLLVVSGCGGSSPAHGPSHAPLTAGSTTAPPTVSASLPPGTVNQAYCGTKDTPIPGAAQALANGQSSLPNISPVQQVWFAMAATTVPACSEITPDPPRVVTKNLTQGSLSDGQFQKWIQEDELFWTLVEWGQEHNQPNFIQYLFADASNSLTQFIRAGGTVTESQACEYASKFDAVSVTGAEMSAVTQGVRSTPGIVYIGAAVGPCTSTWVASDGTVIHHNLAQGQEARELDVTTTRVNPALGTFLVVTNAWDPNENPTADDLFAQVNV